tara:strand:- start:21892 stop:22539 length:648 start_codon:yes stop_codon:yes gene_type:complete
MKNQAIIRTDNILTKMAANMSENDVSNNFKSTKQDVFYSISKGLGQSGINNDDLNIRFYYLNDNPVHAVLTDEDNNLLFDFLEQDRTDYDFDSADSTYVIKDFGNQEVTFKGANSLIVRMSDFRENYVNNIEAVCQNKNLKQSSQHRNTSANSSVLGYILEGLDSKEVLKKIDIQNQNLVNGMANEDLNNFVSDYKKGQEQKEDNKNRSKNTRRM